MTYATDVFHPAIRLREWFEAGRKAAVIRRAQRSAYVRTLRELERSSDRDLADIGISRLSIKEIAYEATYGNPKWTRT